MVVMCRCIVQLLGLLTFVSGQSPPEHGTGCDVAVLRLEKMLSDLTMRVYDLENQRQADVIEMSDLRREMAETRNENSRLTTELDRMATMVYDRQPPSTDRRVDSQQPNPASNVNSQQPNSDSNISSQQTNAASNVNSQQPNPASNVNSQQPNSDSNIRSQQTNADSNISSQQTNPASNINSQQPNSDSNISSQQPNSDSNINSQQTNVDSNINSQQTNADSNNNSQQLNLQPSSFNTKSDSGPSRENKIVKETTMNVDDTSRNTKENRIRSDTWHHSTGLASHLTNRVVSGGTVAFFATLDHILPDVAKEQVIQYPTVVTNNGAHYNPNSGVFTCRTEGTYVFSWTVYASSANYILTELMKNGHAFAYNRAGDTQYHEASSTTAVVNLSPGDMVWTRVQDRSTGADIKALVSMFCGFKI